MILAMRLRDKGGAHYVFEKLPFENAAEANKQAFLWWREAQTISVIVQVHDREDARYTRETIKAERVPVTWPEQKTIYGTKLEAPPAVVTEDIAPSLVNPEDDEPTVRVETPATIVLEGTARCWTCKHAVQEHPGDDDPTPSGRLEAMRCPECGKPMGAISRRAIYQMYLRGQSEAGVFAQSTKLKGFGKRPV